MEHLEVQAIFAELKFAGLFRSHQEMAAVAWESAERVIMVQLQYVRLSLVYPS